MVRDNVRPGIPALLNVFYSAVGQGHGSTTASPCLSIMC